MAQSKRTHYKRSACTYVQRRCEMYVRERKREVASSTELFRQTAGGLRNEDCDAVVTEVSYTESFQHICFDLAAIKNGCVLIA